MISTFLLSTISCQQTTRVNTLLGQIEGIVKIVRNETVYQFRKIPYAKPPTGDLRFAKPVPHGSWSGVLNGTRFGPSCMQPPYENYIYDKFKPDLALSEDCLTLNIYVPRNISLDASRSVMVWIHGGSFYVGQGSMYDGSYLALTGDVVVVTINYRLGAFGFLASPEHGIHGNYGLWDQRLALQWVKSNIASFSGNPSSVTLFGQSAGGFSVSLHAILPESKGLFHRVISESGSSEGPFTIWHAAIPTSDALIGLGDCNSSESYLVCMRNRSATDIVEGHQYLVSQLLFNTRFELPSGPVVDKDFLPSDPHNILMNKSSDNYRFFQSLDFITGNVDSEGSISIGILSYFDGGFTTGFNRMNLVTLCDYFLPDFTKFIFREKNRPALSKILCSFYAASNSSHQEQNAMHAYADATLIAPAVKTLLEHSNDNNLTNSFQYLFHRRDIDPIPQNLYSIWTNGSTHGAEMAYLFGLEDYPAMYNISVTPADVDLSRTMMKYWTNFAKTGDPNSDGVPRWETYNVTIVCM